MTIEDDSVWAGKHLQQTYSASSPANASVFDRSSLFKVSRVSGTSLYVIRSMLNNNLSFGISGTEIITKEIPSADSDVAYADTFYIEWDGYSFLIYPHGTFYAIKMSSTSTANLTKISKYSDDFSDYARWNLVQYTGVNKGGAVMYRPVTLNAGTTVVFTPIVWSTDIDCNTPELSVATGYTDKATSTWDSSTRKGTFVLHNNGTLTVSSKIYKSSSSSPTYSFTHAVTLTLVIAEDTYFFKNKAVGKYMQIDNNDGPDYDESGSIMELWGFDGGDYQKWQLVHVGDGYYKILSVQSGLAVCVDYEETDEDEVALVQESYSSVNRKKWKITKSSSGAYIFRPKSGESYSTDRCMCAGDQFLSITDGLNVEQKAYVNDNSYKDEWLPARIRYESSVIGEGQQKSYWCWVTSARMFSKHSYPSVTYTQADAVRHVKGSAGNYSGNRVEVQLAINYYISNIAGASIDMVVKDYVIYSEDNLVRFLDDGHVVYISRGWYSDPDDPDTRNGGHATLLYGYTTIDSDIWFLVRDPLPIDEGEAYMISYEKLCNGAYCRDDEVADTGVWYASIVVNTSYANETIPYYFDE